MFTEEQSLIFEPAEHLVTSSKFSLAGNKGNPQSMKLQPCHSPMLLDCTLHAPNFFGHTQPLLIHNKGNASNEDKISSEEKPAIQKLPAVFARNI